MADRRIVPMNKYISIGLLVLLSTACCSHKNIFNHRINESLMNTSNPFFMSKKDKLAIRLYNAVYGEHFLLVQELLEKGADPNYCRGEVGWIDSNPLNVLSRSFYGTYYKRQLGDIIPNPVPDVVVFQLLIEAGADVNLRPYIWDRVYLHNNNEFDAIKSQRRIDKQSVELNDMQDQIDCYINDANRLLEAFLKAGSDPDKLGHPYPYSYEAIFKKLTDEQVNGYFSKGTRAINVAIEKGILWESQVDLLLQYTKLDEESLRAAERSDDPAMIEKINRLWEQQQN
jgi:hypothetical protein